MKNWTWILLVAIWASCTQTQDTQEQSPAQQDTVAAVPLESLTPYLMAPEAASEKLHKPGWVWLDVRKVEEYNEGHITGALQIYRPDFQSSAFDYKGMMPAQHELETLLSAKGISATDTILLYDQYGNVNAARLWWLLRQFGHENMALLHGGYTKWTALQLPTDTLAPAPTPAAYFFRGRPMPDINISKEEVLAAMSDSNYVIVDTRSWEEYTGEMQKDGASRPGHIPGSIWCDYIYTLNYDGDYTFQSIAALQQLFDEKGITKDKKIITYCHSGVRSALTLYVLQELLHYPYVRNYDGSWVEWSYYAELPAATSDPLIQ